MIKQIENISISNSVKTLDLFDGSIKMGVTNFTSKRKVYKVHLKNYTYCLDNEEWEDQEIVVTFNNTDSTGLYEAIEFLHEEHTSFLLEFTYGTNTFMTYVFLETTQLEMFRNSGGLERRELRFIQQTPFFKLKVYDYEVGSKPDEEERVFPYTYPVEFPSHSGNYTTGHKDVFVEGDGNAPIKLEIFGPCENPKVFVNETEDPENNVQVYYSLDANAVVTVNSLMANKEFTITEGLNDPIAINNNREFKNSRGYISVKKGKNIFKFNNIVRARITVYEKYLALR